MIDVLACGPLVSIQDQGRPGFRRFGISSAGAMDGLALAVGNILVGNEPGAASIEITASGFRGRFLEDVAFALSGADGAASLNGRDLPPHWVVGARAGQELSIRVPKKGMRVYVTVAGGIDVPEVLGSRSTDVKSCFGGMQGRSLVAGDRLQLLPRSDVTGLSPVGFGVKPFSLSNDLIEPDDQDITLVRAIPAAQHESFSSTAQTTFWSTDWSLRPDSNRMGLRLAGPTLVPLEHIELLSHGILPGIVQVPPSGQPIIQVSDANTCGGYPKMAVVVGADLWRLGQVRLGAKIRFMKVTQESAFAALADQKTYLARVAKASQLARFLGSKRSRPR